MLIMSRREKQNPVEYWNSGMEMDSVRLVLVSHPWERFVFMVRAFFWVGGSHKAETWGLVLF